MLQPEEQDRLWQHQPTCRPEVEADAPASGGAETMPAKAVHGSSGGGLLEVDAAPQSDRFMSALMSLAKVHCEEMDALRLENPSLKQSKASQFGANEAPCPAEPELLPVQPPPSLHCGTLEKGSCSRKDGKLPVPINDRMPAAANHAGGLSESSMPHGQRQSMPEAFQQDARNTDVADGTPCQRSRSSWDGTKLHMRHYRTDGGNVTKYNSLQAEEGTEGTNAIDNTNDSGMGQQGSAKSEKFCRFAVEEDEEQQQAADAETPSEQWGVMVWNLLCSMEPQGRDSAEGRDLEGRDSLASNTGDHADFQLLPHFMPTQGQGRGPSGEYAKSLIFERHEGVRVGDSVCDPVSRLQPFMFHPQGLFRLAFVSIGMLFLGLDAITIPLNVFDLGELAHALDFISQIVAVYWLVDLVFQFLIGYQTTDGTVEMRPAYVQRSYLRGAFASSLAIVLIDWALIIAEMLNPDMLTAAKSGTTSLRLVRLCRLTRMLRVRRLGAMTSCITNKLKSDYLVLATNIAKHVLMILLANHYISCAWYFLATIPTDEASWIKIYCDEGATAGELYVMSLHWALTQFSPSTQNIAPTSPRERVFAICVVLFALLAFSSFISSVTNAVNQLRTINMGKILEEARIREFLKARDVSTKLVGNVQQFFSQNYHLQKQRIHESDIKFFKEIPESLRIQLHMELYCPYLKEHMTFRMLSWSDISLIRKICHFAMHEASVLPQQDIFIDGTEAAGMYFVTKGLLSYQSSAWLGSKKKGCSISSSVGCNSEMAIFPQKDEATSLQVKQWASEMAMWVVWVHRGHMMATTYSTLAKLAPAELGKVISQSETRVHGLLRIFAILCVAYAEGAEAAGNPLSDLPIEDVIISEMIQRAYGFSRLQALSKKNSKGGVSLQAVTTLSQARHSATEAVWRPWHRLRGAAWSLTG